LSVPVTLNHPFWRDPQGHSLILAPKSDGASVTLMGACHRRI